MKRLLAFLCTLAMILVLAGCGSTDSGSTFVPETPKDGSTAQTDSQQANPDEDETEETQPAPEAAPFQEIVVLDDENCTIKITGIEEDNLWGYTLNAYLENKSADTTFMFSVTSASINGVDADPFFAAEVAAGKKSNESISFSTDELEENGAGEFTDIELNFRVYNSNDWSADDIAQVSVHVYPYGEGNATKFVREAKETDIILVDNEYATVIVTGYNEDDFLGYSAELYIVNKTDVTIMVTTEETSVNGFMLDPFYADSVTPGNSAFSSITWLNTSLSENSITEIESIEFILRVYNNDDWLAEDFVNELITLNP